MHGDRRTSQRTVVLGLGLACLAFLLVAGCHVDTHVSSPPAPIAAAKTPAQDVKVSDSPPPSPLQFFTQPPPPLAPNSVVWTGPSAHAPADLAQLVALGHQPAYSQLVLSDHAETAYRIYIGSAADPVEFYAARELAAYLECITGASFRVFATDAAPGAGPCLIVGRHNALADALLTPLARQNGTPDAESQGFVIRAAGPHLFLAGASPIGTLNAVHWFLDRELGVRWFASDCTRIPRRARLVWRPRSIEQSPRFEYREVMNFEAGNTTFANRNLLNAPRRANHQDPLPVDVLSHQWPLQIHNLDRLVPPMLYDFREPEYFVGGQVAMMNPALRRVIARAVLRQAADHPAAACLSVMQMDHGWNPDPASGAFAQRHGGTLAAPLVDLVSQVAVQLHHQFPDRKLATFAYRWSFPPPTGMPPIPANLRIIVAPIQADFAQPFDALANYSVADGILGWCGLCNDIYLWDYGTDFGCYSRPYPDLHVMFQNIRWAAHFSQIHGYMDEGAYTSPGGDFSVLRAWVGARLLWDPTLDPEPLIQEFLRGYYGPAADGLDKFIRLSKHDWASVGQPLRLELPANAPFFSYDYLHKADQLFDQAAQAVKTDPGFARHVAEARLGIDWLICERHTALAARGTSLGETWPGDRAARLARIRATIAANHVTHFGEGNLPIGPCLDHLAAGLPSGNP
ncbi:MAG: DUF4838 domain-containing protein [Planctomycetota bacterium]